MTDTEFAILHHLSVAGPTDAKIFWYMFGLDNYHATDRRLAEMMNKKYIKRKAGSSRDLDCYELLPAGEDALDAEEKQRLKDIQYQKYLDKNKSPISPPQRSAGCFEFSGAGPAIISGLTKLIEILHR